MLKIYKNGEEFLEDNREFLKENILEERYFLGNSKTLGNPTKESFALKITKDDKKIIALKNINAHPNMEILGDVELVCELVEVMTSYGFVFSQALINGKLCEAFINSYQRKMGGVFNIATTMEIMATSKKVDFIEPVGEKASENDIDEICEITKLFIDETKVLFSHDIKEHVKSLINDYYVIRQNNEIASVARASITDEKISYISSVFTKEKYRNQKLSQKLMAMVLNEIVSKGKVAALYVDKSNPISNHVYKKLGFEYETPMYQITYKESNIKECVLAGGCFWCASKPYYEYDGILNVYSGYTGGSEISPSYEDVKKQKTSHKEAIKLIYDSNIISFKEILDIYFNTIDPFDDGGQFIDRGASYTTAIYYNNEADKNLAIYYINDIESRFKQTVYVEVLEEMIFYMAEEYHQDYAIKNPVEMEKELIESGRINKKD
ncbi:MAG: peptide-methionine (S)-S-oxide reductase MsrA [Acholeplasmatales bacterium]|nr:peptide-methionine (S)-S-oxide reductase MsrA [Acholeplasmatales bacterium]